VDFLSHFRALQQRTRLHARHEDRNKKSREPKLAGLKSGLISADGFPKKKIRR
jgi:hypothetical protein